VRRPTTDFLLLGFCILIAAAVTSPRQAHAGAWTKTLGEYYIKAGADFYKAARYVDPTTGDEVENIDFFAQQYSLYAEFGLIPWWPLQVSVLLPLSVSTSRFTDDMNFPEGETGLSRTVRLGDLRVLVQTSILHKDFQLSPAFELKVPLYSNNSVGSKFGTWQEAFPMPGDGQLDLTGWLLAGGGLPKTPLFIQGGVGYRHRTETFVDWDTNLEFVDGIPFTTTVGASFGPFLGMLQVDGIKNIQEDEVTGENLSVGLGVFVTVWKGLAIEGRFAGDVWANNTAQGVSWGFGLSWRSPYPGKAEAPETATPEPKE